MLPQEGDEAPDVSAVLTDGETFQSTTLSIQIDGGAVLIFSAFVFSAIAENWWKTYAERGWEEFDVPVIGVTRDGPYAQNAFQRTQDLSFQFFSDVDASVSDAYDLTMERKGMANISTGRRAIFVLDHDRRVTMRWLGDDWISPPPQEEIEQSVSEL